MKTIDVPSVLAYCHEINADPVFCRYGRVDKIVLVKERFEIGLSKAYEVVRAAQRLDPSLVFVGLTGHMGPKERGKYTRKIYPEAVTVSEKITYLDKKEFILGQYDKLLDLARQSVDFFLNSREGYIEDLENKRYAFCEVSFTSKRVKELFEVEEEFLAKELWLIANYPTEPLYKQLRRELDGLIDSINHSFPDAGILTHLRKDLTLLTGKVDAAIASLVWKDIVIANGLFD